MDVTNRQDFLVCLDRHPSLNELDVFTFSKKQLIIAINETGFEDFCGYDYEVMGRLGQVLRQRDSEAALWGLVFIDLWHCSNFGGQHWNELVARDCDNV